MSTAELDDTLGVPSFEHFHRRHAADVLRYARAIDPDIAEDACQEAWLKAWRAWGSAEPGKAVAWLRTIVRHCCVDVRRRRVLLLLDEAVEPASVAPDEAALAGLELDSVWRQLELHSPVLREALWLREVESLTYAEIARRQGVPIGTVMSRLHAARVHARRLRSGSQVA